MREKEINPKEIEHLLEDVAYLQDEAEALTYVIDEVPYDEETPDGESIRGYLTEISDAGADYYRPVIEKVIREHRTVSLSDRLSEDTESKDSDQKDPKEIAKVIRGIGKQRASLISLLGRSTLYDWQKPLREEGGNEITLFRFVRSMVTRERALLKKIADLVMIYQNERAQQREIEKKSASRKAMME